MRNMRSGVTPRQLEVLLVIHARLVASQFSESPTVREIGEKIGTKATSRVAELLTALVRRGLIEQHAGKTTGSVKRVRLSLTPKGIETITKAITVQGSIPTVQG